MSGGGPGVILVKRLDHGVALPARAHPGDAGLDLAAAEAVSLAPGERAAVGTGIAVAIPDGFAGLVTPRSGLALRHGLGIVNAPGVVDSGYRGEIRVILVNLGAETVRLERGERIAQMVVVPAGAWEAFEVPELPPSERGSDGFGSSGR